MAESAQADADDDFAEVKALFDQVCDLPDDAAVRARLAELDTRASVVESVLALVREDAANSTRFSRPVAAVLASAAGPELQPGERLGAWTLQAELGQGGMGQVFLATRSDGHYEQRAAVKLLRGFSDPQALARLARERQILAGLNHPNIARLIDGGTTPAGRPYLVMDFVEGRPLDDYLREQAPGLDAALDLFDMVCEAVAHAHRQLVVHCDIKPGNVLVDREGRAKLLDFGIAHLQGRGDDEAPRALTPRYASPEQLAGEPAGTPSDIYSLGRLLEEILQSLGPAARRRQREWQAIVARACAADPAQRYGSVGALQEDLRRFRAQRPVRAVQGGGLYVLRKGLRRRWPWVLAGIGVLALSTAFALRLVQERDRAVLAEAQARKDAATTRQVSDFMVDLFNGADPARSGKPDVSAVDLVDKGRQRMASELKGQPELLGTLQGVLGRVYSHMGKPRSAIELYQQAIDEERRLGHAEREAQLQRQLSGALADAGYFQKAADAARRALALRQQAGLPASTLEMADLQDGLGNALAGQGDFANAEIQLNAALHTRQKLLGPVNASVSASLHSLALLARFRGDAAGAAELFGQSVAMKRQTLGMNDLSTLAAQQQLGAALSRMARYDEAEALLLDLVQRRQAVQGPTSDFTARAWNELASNRQDAGRLDAAVQAYRQALAIHEQASGRQSIVYAVTLNNLGSALDESGDRAGSEAAYRESLAIRQALLPAGDITIARAQHNLARWLLREARAGEARPLMAQALAVRAAKLPPGHDDVLNSQLTLAEIDFDLGQRAAARQLSEAAAAQESQMNPLRHAALMRMQALLLESDGQPKEALRLRQAGLALALTKLPPGNANLLRPRLELARLELKLGQAAAAREQMQAMRPLIAAQRPDSPLRREAERFGQQLARQSPG